MESSQLSEGSAEVEASEEQDGVGLSAASLSKAAALFSNIGMSVLHVAMDLQSFSQRTRRPAAARSPTSCIHVLRSAIRRALPRAPGSNLYDILLVQRLIAQQALEAEARDVDRLVAT